MPSQRAAKVSRLVTILGSVISLAITTTGCTWLKGSEDRLEATKQAESGKPLQPVAESEMVFILLEQIYADKLNTHRTQTCCSSKKRYQSPRRSR